MNLSDEQLVKKCLEKDPLAQKLFFDTYSTKMMGVCLRYTKDKEEAEDVLQLAFIKIFAKLHMFNNEGSLDGWIRKIVVNTALDSIRKNKKFLDNVEMEKVDFQLHNKEVSGQDNLQAEDLLKIIQTLPTGFRTVFNLYAIEGYSHKEIADELGISVNTSKSQYSRAKVYLQKLLEKEKIEQH